MKSVLLCLVILLMVCACEETDTDLGLDLNPGDSAEDFRSEQYADQGIDEDNSDENNDEDSEDDNLPKGGNGSCADKFDSSITDMEDPRYCPDGLTTQACPLDGNNKACKCECPSAQSARTKMVADLVWNEICDWDIGDIRSKSCRTHFASANTRTVCTVPNDAYLEGIVDLFRGKAEGLLKLVEGFVDALRQQYTLGNSATYPFGFRIYCGTNPISDPNGSKASWGDGDISIGDCLVNSSCDDPILDK